jgi:tRNA dimethylallyltransferase
MRSPLHHHIDQILAQERAQRVGRGPVACVRIRSKEHIGRHAGQRARGHRGLIQRRRTRIADQSCHMNHEEDHHQKAKVARAVLIAGPTASGKSALALDVAERLGGIVVNADAMQVYRDLRILTARPSAEEEARVPHRLFGHVDAAESYSVGRWLRDVAPVLEEAARCGALPIVVGGTGLYLKALTEGLAAIPPIPPPTREALRARLADQGAGVLHAELTRRDPVAAARLPPGDGVRIVRALEVIEATGQPLSAWHRAGMPALVDTQNALKVVLSLERGTLHQRIDVRFDGMMTNGALQEVQALHARGLDPLLPAMKAHGVPRLIAALEGQIPLPEAVDAAKRDTRRYTKRQLTWFRNQLPDWPWSAAAEAERAILKTFASFRSAPRLT